MRKDSQEFENYLANLMDWQRPPTLTFISEQLKKDEKLGINIGDTEGFFLAFLIQALNVRSILEIGTQYGYSTTWFLSVLPQEGHLISIERDIQHYEIAQKNLHDSRCQLICGDALEVLRSSLTHNMFDLIFIDANKKAYPAYLQYAMEHVNPGGLIVGDNTFLFGEVFDPGKREVPNSMAYAMHIFNQKIFSDKRFVSCMIPTSEGLTIAMKKRAHQN
ncbi:MAG: O-methyltransferase [Bdellovibrionaceae bacterium]|nr:O-methyltransferase [Pseudobdellovibrionaceae bacterium]